MAGTTSTSTASKSTGATRRRKPAASGQMPMVVEVQDAAVKFDASSPAVRAPIDPDQAAVDRAAEAAAPMQVPALPPSVAAFAAGIGYVEALATTGDHELIMQLARIAYTRGRQVARAAGVEMPGQ